MSTTEAKSTAATTEKNIEHPPQSSSNVQTEKSFSSTSSSSSNTMSSRLNKPSTLQRNSSSTKISPEKDDEIVESDTDNTSSSAASQIAENLRVEDLEILKTIGTGTFARVCLCRLRNSPNGANNNNNNAKQQSTTESGSNAQPQQPPRVSKYFALKILTMHDVIRLKQVEHIKNEKNILMDVNHPFIIDLVWHAKDSKTFLYMIFPYVCGGELFSYLRNAGRFNASTSLSVSYTHLTLPTILRV